MGWDDYYGNKPPSEQLSLFENDLYTEAMAWRVGHADEWGYMVGLARKCKRERGWVPAKLLIENTRFWRGVAIKNALAPYIARIIESECPDLRGTFKKHKSKADEVAYESN